MKNLILRTAISLGFIGLLFYFTRDQIPQIIETLSQVNKPLLGASAAVFVTSVWILAYRLRLIFKAKGVPLTLSDAVNLTFVGYFFNNFIPTSVGGDIVKAMCASRITKNPVKSATSVLMDRVFGLFVFILIPSLTLVFYMKNMDARVPIIVYSLLVFSAFCFFMIFNRGMARRFSIIETWLNKFGWGEKARQVYDNLHDFRNHKKAVVGSMLLSVLGQTISILVLYAMAVALGSHTALVYFFLLVPVVHLVSMVPISIGGLGIREGAYVIFFKDYMGEHNAVALGILWLGLLFLLSLIGGLIYLVRQDYHIRGKEAGAPA